MSETVTSKRSLIVEWGDCDPADIVFYPNYFSWFDASTASHFNSVGLPKQILLERFSIIGYPMVDTRGKFYIPSSYGDELTVETKIVKFGNSSFEVEHRLYRDNVLAVECFEKRVMVRKKSNGSDIEALPVPEDIKVLFQFYPPYD